MKIFIILFTLILFEADPAVSQIRKGEFLIGGNINFTSTENDRTYSGNYHSNQFSISPNLGYFVMDKLAGGLRLDLGFFDSESETVETRYTSTSISPFLRYYFLPTSNKVNLLLDVAYLHEKMKFATPPNPGYYERSSGYSIFAGPSLFLTPHVALEFTAGWKHTNSDDFDKTKTDIFNTGFGLQIYLDKLKKKSR